MQNVLICGAGMSATDLISYMLNHAEEFNWQVTVGDIDVPRAERKISGHSRGRAVYFDCYDAGIMENYIKDADIVISLLPPGMHAAAAKIALKHQAHVVTASYASEEMIALDDEAKAKGLTFLNELGADPGIDHMNGMRSIDKIREKGGKLLAFKSYCGSLVAPESNDNPWGYKFTWSPLNVITAGSAGACYYEQYRLRCIPYHEIFSQPRTISIPGFRDFEAYKNRDSAAYRKKYGLDNLPTLIRATLRYPGFCESWNLLIKLGLTAHNYRIADSAKLTYRQWLAAYLPYKPGNLEDTLANYLSLKPNGELHQRLLWTELLSERPITIKNGTPAEILLDLLKDKLKFQVTDTDMLVFYEQVEYQLGLERKAHISWLVTKGLDHQHTAISRTVGLPAAIGAKLILNGQLNDRGIIYPWYKKVYQPVLAELADLGIAYKTLEKTIA